MNNKNTSIKDSLRKDWWMTISENEKKSFKKGLLDLEEGRVYPNQFARKIYEKYL